MIQKGNATEKIFGTFPREFGKHRSFITNKTDFYYMANKYNGFMNLYASIYSIPEKRNYRDAIVDKLYFDLDNMQMVTYINPRCWLATKRLHFYLKDKKLKHMAFLTGRGFNVFIFTEIKKLYNPKEAIKNAQEYIAQESELKIGGCQKSDIDEHIIGDIARITRIPNTWNLKAKRFCIPLIEDDFYKSYDEICMIAEKQRFKFEVFGNKLLDLAGFDSLKSNEEIECLEDFDVPEGCDFEIYIKMLPPVIQRLLITTKCGWRDRYLTILAIKEIGLPKSLCNKICQKYWTPQKYRHAVRDEHQIDYIYRRENLMFPNWSTIIHEGYEVTKKDLEFKFYKDRI